MIGIYHNRDIDGFASGAIIKRKYPHAKMIGYDYGQQFSFTRFNKNEDVIMADVSLPLEGMFLIWNLSKSFTWIDHHISAINDYNNCDNLKGIIAILDNGISACEGTWKYLFPKEEMPESILLWGEYDTWRNKNKNRWDNHILPFQFGSRILCSSLEGIIINKMLENDDFLHNKIDKITNDGKMILDYQSSVNETQCKKAAFETKFEGLRAICLNGGGFNSDVFKTVYDESKHDIMMPFQYDGKQWIVSLYTTKKEIDCSVIAKLKGGGGHKKAAGFQVKDIRDIFSNMNL